MTGMNLLTFIFGAVSSGLVGSILLIGARVWWRFSWRASVAWGVIGLILSYWAVLYLLVIFGGMNINSYPSFARPGLPILAGSVYFAFRDATKIIKRLVIPNGL